jgi:hypothetical protein
MLFKDLFLYILHRSSSKLYDINYYHQNYTILIIIWNKLFIGINEYSINIIIRIIKIMQNYYLGKIILLFCDIINILIYDYASYE